MKKLVFNRYWVVFSILTFIWSCQPDDDQALDLPSPVSAHSAEVAVQWNQQFLEIERYMQGYRPGPAPRALAYIGLAAYEACLPGMDEFQSVASRYPNLSIHQVQPNVEYHWPSVLNALYAHMFSRFFPVLPAPMEGSIEELEAEINTGFGNSLDATVRSRSTAYGVEVAEAFWQWSTTDSRGHDAYLNPFGDYDWRANYTRPGNYVITQPGPNQPMFPYWGDVRTFAISQDDKISPPPVPYSEAPNSAMYAKALEVVNASSDVNWRDGQWIAFYWSDDITGLTFSPGPRFLSIANQVVVLQQTGLDYALYGYAKLGLALNDASVACWHSKYLYNIERPESYIQRVIDPSWEPSLRNPLTGAVGISPAFPAYPSGHSTMGAAAAEVLTNVFGHDFAMLDRSHEGRTEFNGTPRRFNNFYEMAEENAYSRIPLGVHWRMDCVEGLRLGYLCGRRVNALDWHR